MMIRVVIVLILLIFTNQPTDVYSGNITMICEKARDELTIEEYEQCVETLKIGDYNGFDFDLLMMEGFDNRTLCDDLKGGEKDICYEGMGIIDNIVFDTRSPELFAESYKKGLKTILAFLAAIFGGVYFVTG